MSVPRISYASIPKASPPATVPNPPAMSRDATVAFLGSSKQENQKLGPYFQVFMMAARRLSAMGYNVLTGGSPGANYYGNLGAPLNRSFAIHVTGWDAAANRRKDGTPLYQDYAVLNNGAERTLLLNKSCKVILLAPGGPGSLQEAAVALEAMYYGAKVGKDAPDKIVFVGREYWRPLLGQFANMVNWGLADADRLRKLIGVVDVRPGRAPEAVDKIVEFVTGQKPKPTSLFRRIGLYFQRLVEVLRGVVAKYLQPAFARLQGNVGPAPGTGG